MNNKEKIENQAILDGYKRQLEDGTPLTDEQVTEVKEIKRKLEKREVEKMENTNNQITEFERALRGEVEFRALDYASNGAIVPNTISDRIIAEVKELFDLNNFDVYQIPGTITIPVDNSNLGVMTAITEGSPISPTEVNAFTSVKLEAKPYGKVIKIGKKLANNSAFDVVSYFQHKMADAVALTLSKLACDAIFAKEETVDIEAEVKADDVLNMLTSLNPVYLEGAYFVCDRAMFQALAKLKDGQGNYLLANGIVNNMVTYTIFGKKIIVTEHAKEDHLALICPKSLALKLGPVVECDELVEFKSSYQVALLGTIEADVKIVEPKHLILLKKTV